MISDDDLLFFLVLLIKISLYYFSLSFKRDKFLTLGFWPNSNYLTRFFSILLTTFSNYCDFFTKHKTPKITMTISDHPSPDIEITNSLVIFFVTE